MVANKNEREGAQIHAATMGGGLLPSCSSPKFHWRLEPPTPPPPPPYCLYQWSYEERWLVGHSCQTDPRLVKQPPPSPIQHWAPSLSSPGAQSHEEPTPRPNTPHPIKRERSQGRAGPSRQGPSPQAPPLRELWSGTDRTVGTGRAASVETPTRHLQGPVPIVDPPLSYRQHPCPIGALRQCKQRDHPPSQASPPNCAIHTPYAQALKTMQQPRPPLSGAKLS